MHPSSKDEALQFGYLCVVGAAKEAADAFRDCDSQGLFGWLDCEDTLEDLLANVKHLRVACDRQDPISVYSRLLAPLRHKSAFHFDRSKIAAAIKKLENEEFTAAETDAETHVLGVPMARSILAEISWLSLVSADQVHHALSEIDDVRKALIAVGQDMYLIHIRLATELPETAT